MANAQARAGRHAKPRAGTYVVETPLLSVLFGAQVALIVEPFGSRTALIVLAVGWRIRRRAVLSRWIEFGRRASGETASVLRFALHRMAR